MKKSYVKIFIVTLILSLAIPSSVFANNGRGNGVNNRPVQPGPPSHAQSRQNREANQVNTLTTREVSSDQLTESTEIENELNKENEVEEEILEETDKDESNQEVVDEIKDDEQASHKKDNGLNGLLTALENVRHTPAFDTISRLVEHRGGTVDTPADIIDEPIEQDSDEEPILEDENIDELVEVVIEDDADQEVDEQAKYKNNNGLNGLLRALENVRHTPAFDVISRLVELRGGTVDTPSDVIDEHIEQDTDEESILEDESIEDSDDNIDTDLTEDEIDYESTP